MVLEVNLQYQLDVEEEGRVVLYTAEMEELGHSTERAKRHAYEQVMQDALGGTGAIVDFAAPIPEPEG
jgi:hypothetical protein